MHAQLLGRPRKENHLNPGGGGCSELRSHHYTPAWATRARLCLQKKSEEKIKAFSMNTNWEGLLPIDPSKGISKECTIRKKMNPPKISKMQ